MKKKLIKPVDKLQLKKEHDYEALERESKLRKILPYDHLPRFQNGIRNIQGGLPELGRSR